MAAASEFAVPVAVAVGPALAPPTARADRAYRAKVRVRVLTAARLARHLAVRVRVRLRLGLGLRLGWMHVQVRPLGLGVGVGSGRDAWALDVGVADRAGKRGVVRLSTFQVRFEILLLPGCVNVDVDV